VFSNFFYVLETIIQAGRNPLAVAHLPIRISAKEQIPEPLSFLVI
jgi:hypothetical protein